MNVKYMTEEVLEVIRSLCKSDDKKRELNEGIREFLSDNYTIDEIVNDDAIKERAFTIMKVDEFPEKDLEQWAKENGWVKEQQQVL